MNDTYASTRTTRLVHLLQEFWKVTFLQYLGVVPSISAGPWFFPLSSTGPQRESPFEVCFFGGWVL